MGYTATRPMSRRRFLALSGGAVVLAACGSGDSGGGLIQARDPAVRRREDQRRRGASVAEHRVVAKPLTLDLAGTAVETWGYDIAEIKVRRGDVLRATLVNELPDETSIHWHGIALRNDMDGVADLTQGAVTRGAKFTYDFAVPDAGTYFFHPHIGLQLDRALYAALVVEDPNEPVPYDVEHVVVLDDWLDGIDGTPETALAALTSGEGGPHAAHGEVGAQPAPAQRSRILGGHAGDVVHPMHLVNRRPPRDRPTFEIPPGGRGLLRIINAASDTAYRVCVGGQAMLVTHTDGFPVEPVEVDSLLIGMGERYDVLISAPTDPAPFVAVAEGKDGAAVAVVRARGGTGAAPPVDIRPAELDGRMLDDHQLVPRDDVALKKRPPMREVVAELGEGPGRYRWTINDRAHPDDVAVFEVRVGERVKLSIRNKTTMWHPMHLHGHTFALRPGGARKDTVKVLPGKTVAVEFDADNPGQWMFHCHNTYHLEAGMAAVVGYIR